MTVAELIMIKNAGGRHEYTPKSNWKRRVCASRMHRRWTVETSDSGARVVDSSDLLTSAVGSLKANLPSDSLKILSNFSIQIVKSYTRYKIFDAVVCSIQIRSYDTASIEHVMV